MKRIVLKDVSKRYHLKIRKPVSALYNFKTLFSRNKEINQLVALNKISFNVKAGEVVGIIGRNGSGKSTLLRCIAGIYNIDSGKIETNGKIVFLPGFEIGLHEKLTMRENIYLIGSLFGLSSREIKEKFDSIVEFSELNDFVDVKISKFSTGMSSRLSFATIINCVSHSKPDILLIDEFFEGGGDENFKSKSISKVEELIKYGSAVILVSHSLKTIEKYCDEVILLEKGEIVKIGKPKKIIDYYVHKSKPHHL